MYVSMLQHTKRRLKLFEMYCLAMFITALCVIFLIKLRWPKNMSLYEHRTSAISLRVWQA